MLGGKLAVIVIIMISLNITAASALPTAHHGTAIYDPSKCAHDPKGMVYFAVGRRVFRQPMENITYITGGSDKWRATLPIPPHPAEPEGCPDHPIQGVGYDLSHFSPLSAGKANSNLADHISVVIANGFIPNTADGLFKLLRAERGVDPMGIPGFIVTAKQNIKDYFTAYEIQQYLTPLGSKMTVACMVDAEKGPYACDYGYEIHPGVIMYNRFPVAAVPLERLADADREVRQRVNAAEVPSYPWTDVPPGR